MAPPVLGAVTGTWLKLALPLLAAEVAVLGGLRLTGHIDSLALAIGLVLLGAATLVLVRPLARNLEALGGWLAVLDHVGTPSPPVLRSGPGSGALGAMAEAVRELVGGRDRRIDALQAEADRLLDALPDPLLLLARDHRVVRLNRAGRTLFGEGAAGRDLARVVRDPALTEAVDAALADQESQNAEISLPSGHVERAYAVDVAPLPAASGAGPAVMIALHDITAMRRTEQMRVDFVANASHEIRSPLATLIGCIETLRGPARDDTEAQERFLEMMDDQGRRMARLVGDLLSLSRIELKEHAQPTGEVDVAAVLTRLTTSLGYEAEERRMPLELSVPGDLPPVRGDENEVEQVIYNLVSNALKYGRAGTPIMLVARLHAVSPVHLRIARGPAISIAVTDRGEGIPAQHIPRLTERFYRVDTARSRELGGTGLGLAIVKHVLNRHRGELEVESRIGVGSTFTVWLPAVVEAGDTATGVQGKS
ncbi:MAG: ATP-binding protein [Proteobacteria bacterium]|nr:ATP-binding protein [Pseudomonadota bacterium]